MRIGRCLFTPSFALGALLASSLLLGAGAASAREAPVAGSPSPILVSYSFDDELIETGPDTFAVFENAKGDVQLSEAFRTSGSYSVEIRDRSGDGDFPELQGYFPLRRHGTLFLSFALLVVDPSQELNIALAGPELFRLGRNGIAFWLATRAGYLVHTTDSIPKKLVALDPFTWYGVYAEYDIDAGRYGLELYREGSTEPVVVLEDQPNAASQPGSVVDKFSFIGDNGDDRSNVAYYVDDVVVASTLEAVPRPFVAPGRRSFFVDLFERYRGAPPRLECVPTSGPSDFGITESELAELRAINPGRAPGGPANGLDALSRLLSDTATGATRSERTVAALTAASTLAGEWIYGPIDRVLSWQAGCAELAADRPARALQLFDEAADPGVAPIIDLSRALALGGLGRWQEVTNTLAALPAEWQDDPRYGLALARLATRAGDLDEARSWAEWSAAVTTQPEAPPLPLELPADGLASEGATGPETSHARLAQLTAELRFYLRMLEGDYAAAQGFAEALAGATSDLPATHLRWQELTADAAFAAGRLPQARGLYETVLTTSPAPERILLKLADVAWREGDPARERALRERIYGSLVSPKQPLP